MRGKIPLHPYGSFWTHQCYSLLCLWSIFYITKIYFYLFLFIFISHLFYYFFNLLFLWWNNFNVLIKNYWIYRELWIFNFIFYFLYHFFIYFRILFFILISHFIFWFILYFIRKYIMYHILFIKDRGNYAAGSELFDSRTRALILRKWMSCPRRRSNQEISSEEPIATGSRQTWKVWVKMATGPPYYCPSCNISHNMTGIGEGVSRAHECTLCRVCVNIRSA